MTEAAAAPSPIQALAIEDLSISYRVRGRLRPVVRNVSLSIARGESYGLVGESGCGKTTVALAAVRYLPRNGRIVGGRIMVDGRDLGGLSKAELHALRAKSVSMVYQDPARALNPTLRIGRQVAEAYEAGGIKGEEARRRSVEMLKRVRIADPDSVMQRYPHQLSGGMQQRICIAMALAIDPTLLILDEPTTGLDATVEAEILDLIAQLRRDFGTSILFISHNLAVVAKLCDRVGVLYAGTLVEEGPAADLFRNPRHPYTVGLLRCLPARGRRKGDGPLETIPGSLPAAGSIPSGCVFADRCPLVGDDCRAGAIPMLAAGPGRVARCIHLDRPVPQRTLGATSPAPDLKPRPILALNALSKTFRSKGQDLRVLRGIELSLGAGETLGLVGESGSGKTTLARLMLGLTAPDAGGSITLDGKTLAPLLADRSGEAVKGVQIVFQNPDSALNRSHTVRRIVERAIRKLARLTGPAVRERLTQLVEAVRLTPQQLSQRPRQLSGGLKQRVAIARAFAGEPRIVVCDEPTSALDVSVQAAILNLLVDLQRNHQVSYVFISHDLGVVRYLSDRIAVLYLGRLMELGPAEEVFAGPHHPYTEALLSAVPSLDGEKAERIRLKGEIPSAAHPPSGCVFHTRCPRFLGPICEEQEPPLHAAGPAHGIRCHIPVDELARLQSYGSANPAPAASSTTSQGGSFQTASSRNSSSASAASSGP